VALVIGVFLAGDVIHPLGYLAMVLILSGVALLQYGSRRASVSKVGNRKNVREDRSRFDEFRRKQVSALERTLHRLDDGLTGSASASRTSSELTVSVRARRHGRASYAPKHACRSYKLVGFITESTIR